MLAICSILFSPQQSNTNESRLTSWIRQSSDKNPHSDEAPRSNSMDRSEVAAEAAASVCLSVCQRVTPVHSELPQQLGTDSGVNRRKD